MTEGSVNFSIGGEGFDDLGHNPGCLKSTPPPIILLCGPLENSDGGGSDAVGRRVGGGYGVGVGVGVGVGN